MTFAAAMRALESAGCEISPPNGSTVTGGRAPLWIVQPRSLDELSAAVRILAEHDVPWRADSWGRNWGYDDSRVRGEEVVLRLAQLRQLSVDEELGTVTVEPGVTFHDVAQALGPTSRWWLPQPGSGPHTSLLGNALARGLLYGMGERERCCRDFVVMDRADGSIRHWGWEPGIDAQARAALPYPPGPHRQGELFQSHGYGHLVVRMTHTLAANPACGAAVAVLAGPEPSHELLSFWQEGLRDDLTYGSALQPARRRALQGHGTSHDGLTLKFNVLATSRSVLRGKLADVQEQTRAHGLRLVVDKTAVPEDLAIVGGRADDPEGVAQSRIGLEWHTVAMPFVRDLVMRFCRELTCDPLLADVAWTLRALDMRALVWMLPLVFDKRDPASLSLLGERVAALRRLRQRFCLPEYRPSAVHD